MGWKKKTPQEKEEQNKNRIDEFKQKIADNIVSMLESGVDAKWQKPWRGGFDSLPYNPVSNHQYTGGNLTMLMLDMMCKGRNDPRYMTVKQAQEKYGEEVHVSKGEKAEYLLRPSPFFVNEKGKSVSPKKVEKDVKEFLEDFSINKIPSDDPDTIQRIKDIKDKNSLKFSDISYVAQKALGYKERMSYRAYAVFNGGQFENIPDYKDELDIEPKSWKDNFIVENFVQASQAKVQNAPIDRAYYNPKHDIINLPFKEDFIADEFLDDVSQEEAAAANYYATLLHEWAHWTGHESREARVDKESDTIKDYALEELFAESASVMMGSYLDLPVNMEQHAAYLDGWRKIAREEPEVIYSIVQKATKLVETINSFEQCKQPKVPWFPPKEEWEHLSVELKEISTQEDLPKIFYTDGDIDWDVVSQKANLTEEFIENNIEYLNTDLLKENRYVDNNVAATQEESLFLMKP